ncbi:alkaline phosphatase family protein [Sphingobacteriales bacterium UPWRP_1]|nr:hypothetical protein B6N25_06035 [Sphingobacteriales bacterium TSM_CSS]PSJ78631.1 alkaline phosphatase family protein [Sphingobacteriales bacterium UPWRP_1]
MHFLNLLVTVLYMLYVQPLFVTGNNNIYPQPDHALCTGLPMHVVMIGIDGLTTDGLLRASTPVIDGLRKNGAWSMQVQPVQPTLSSPNWASLLTGVLPEVHGIYKNGWKAPDTGKTTSSNSGYELPVPSLFEILRRQHPHATTACFYQWQDLKRLIEPFAPGRFTHTGNESMTVNCAARYIKKHKPAFTFLHLDNVDHAGHIFGYGSKAYIEAIETTDALLNRIVAAVNKSGMAANTVFIITTDHGGIDHNHGGQTPEECNTPFIICGPGIKKGYAIQNSLQIYDIAPTVAKLLGLQPPAHWAGNPAMELFVNHGRLVAAP